MNHFRAWGVFSANRQCFVPQAATKQNWGVTKPFCPSEKTSGNRAWLLIQQRNDGPKRPTTLGTVMIKAFSAVALAALIAAALTVLPGFAPQVEASVPVALAKGDRLDIKQVGRDCSQQAWPNFETSCLRAAGSKSMIREARLVTADRTP
jgi:hypothetical protein